MHAHNDNTAPTQRPASFDAMLVQYRPGLSRLAFKMGFKGEDREDLVTDTIIHCLKHWRTYRPGDAGWNYLYWVMRGVASNKKTVASHRIRFVDDPDGRLAARLETKPSQEHYVELSQTLAHLSGRGGAVIMRRAMTDDTLTAIGSDMGVSRPRVQQIEARARRRLDVACGRVDGVAA